MGKPFASICIITGGNLSVLDACLASIQSQVDAPSFEVIVCSNGGPDVAQLVHARIPLAKVGIAKKTLLGAARNPLVSRAEGDWLLFLDDDVTIGPSFLQYMQKIATEHPEARVLGGPNDTPVGRPAFHIIQGAALASLVVSGPVRRRYGPHPAGPADERFFTLCNLAVRRDVMTGFPRGLMGAEENALLAELHRRGLVMHYDPELAAFHERRPGWKSFATQMLKYGRGRGQLTRQAVSTCRPAYAVPAAFVLYCLAAVSIGWNQPWILAPLVLYTGAVGATTLRIAWDLRRLKSCRVLTTLATATLLIVTVHLCYGLGFLHGLGTPALKASDPLPVWSEPDPASLS